MMNSTPLPSSLPTSLRTATPAEGMALARQLSAQLHAGQPVIGSMNAHLRTVAAGASPEITAAIYFNAIALANGGWGRSAGV